MESSVTVSEARYLMDLSPRDLPSPSRLANAVVATPFHDEMRNVDSRHARGLRLPAPNGKLI
jgi:hypothetical protein